MDGNKSGASSEIEAAGLEDFLWLLKEREDRFGGQAPNGPTGGVVSVSRMLDRRRSRYSFPLVTRYVVAAFSYGPENVIYKRTTSHAVELPEMVKKSEDRQKDIQEEVRVEIGRGMERLGLHVPLQ